MRNTRPLETLPTIRLEKVDSKKNTIQYLENTTLFFILEGKIRITMEDRIINIRTNELFLINSHQIIEWIGDERNLVMVVVLNMSQELLVGERIQLTQPISAAHYQDLHEEVTRILAMLYMEGIEKKEAYQVFIASYLERIKGLILRFLPVEITQGIERNQEINEKIIDMMTYMNHHYQEDLRLDDLAEKFLMSKYYMAHIFKDQVGVSIGKYLKEIRLLKTVKELTQTSNSINDIAYNHGFASTRAFVESFRKKNGVSPAVYRKQQKELKQQQFQQVENSSHTKLFSKFIDKSYGNYYARIDLIEVQIQVKNHIYPKNRIQQVIKMQSENLPNNLTLFSDQMRSHFIAIDQIIDKLKFSNKNNVTSIDFSILKKELRLLLNYRMHPFLQIGVYDYELFEARQTGMTFKEMMLQLKYFLKSQFVSLDEWYLEFRPYYEVNGAGKLCEPIKEVIAFFKDTCPLIIHLPKHPSSTKEVKESNMVEIIDDYMKTIEYPLEFVLEELSHQRYIALIEENQNKQYQLKLLDYFIKIEKDPYYQQIEDLIYANLMMRMLFHAISNSNQKILQSVTLDGEPAFHYFDKELSKKLALITPQGLYTESWYANQFIEKLYEEIVYSNEYSLVTKHQNHYRIILLYGDNFEDSLARLRENEERTDHYQQPTISVKLNLLGITGEYRMTHQEITPNLKIKFQNQFNIKDDERLLEEDLVYINQMHQPKRRVEYFEIENEFILQEEIPLLGMHFIDLRKID